MDAGAVRASGLAWGIHLINGVGTG
jgi:hypothetical protein